MADVTIPELPDHLSRLEIPYFYGPVITSTD